MDTNFIGEHLGPGKLGHFFIIGSFIASLFSTFCYWRAVQTEKKNVSDSLSWQILARNSFIIHTAAVIGIFCTLYYIITHHLFEYHYAWEHSSRALPTKYLLSCFWEGQEGSFMLWTFWHCVLGLVVIGTGKTLETRAMTIISFVQVFLASMLLGFYFSADFKIGSTPFMLLRHSMQNAPIFSDPNYLTNFIHDGNGLNVLLQNYWMVIHPPILFLGFASTLIPFAFIMAALWKGDYKDFVKPAINWTLFSGAVLGTGIMMGGAWAYESLTFGGYWAWDPVENASLVPWLTMVAALHTLLVYRSTGRNFIITIVLYILTYLLVWYSTFLTRTGVLGDTSVHAFTGEGSSLYWHLLVVIGVLMALSIGIAAMHWKSHPRIKKEEEISSREFWMFIGSFVLLLGSVFIIASTSVPVWSPLVKYFTKKDVAINTPLIWYNSIMIWVTIIIALLASCGLFLKFKQTAMKKVWQRFAIISGISALVTLGIAYGQKIEGAQYILFLFTASFGLVSNSYYAFIVQKGSVIKRGPALSHFGFAVILIGILLSSYGKEIISFNTTGAMLDLGKKTEAENRKESRENVLMFRNTPVAMGEYVATFEGDSSSVTDPRKFYKVHYQHVDPTSKKVTEEFTLYPDAFINSKGQQGLIANPASKHYLSRDVFTYVTTVLDPSKMVDTSSFKSNKVHIGDSIYFNSGYLVFKGFDKQVSDPRYTPESGDIAVGATLDAYNLRGFTKEIKPIFYIRGNAAMQMDDTIREFGLIARFNTILPQENAAVIQLKQTDPKDDYIVMKAMVFPYINVLWLGVVVMVAGFLLSLLNGITKKTQGRPDNALEED